MPQSLPQAPRERGCLARAPALALCGPASPRRLYALPSCRARPGNQHRWHPAHITSWLPACCAAARRAGTEGPFPAPARSLTRSGPLHARARRAAYRVQPVAGFASAGVPWMLPVQSAYEISTPGLCSGATCCGGTRQVALALDPVTYNCYYAALGNVPNRQAGYFNMSVRRAAGAGAPARAGRARARAGRRGADAARAAGECGAAAARRQRHAEFHALDVVAARAGRPGLRAGAVWRRRAAERVRLRVHRRSDAEVCQHKRAGLRPLGLPASAVVPERCLAQPGHRPGCAAAGAARPARMRARRRRRCAADAARRARARCQGLPSRPRSCSSTTTRAASTGAPTTWA